MLFFLIPSFSSAQPVIVFEAENHDFGALRAGTPAEHAFEFLNSGNEDLVIQKLSTS
jgi:hypothetical protein